MWNFAYKPEAASEFAVQYDILFIALTVLTVLFTIIVGAMMLVFSVRFRQGNKVNRKNPIDTHVALEITWSVIPLVLGLVMFFWATELYVQTRIPPKNAMDVYVVGKQWMWHIQHAKSGIRENNQLHVPVGVPVRMTMISQDVIHSFFIPAFRAKHDVLPGRYTMIWFTPTKPGTYALFCTEYCGTQHSEMGGYVTVLSQKDWQAWVETGGQTVEKVTKMPAERGKALFEQFRCETCHVERDIDQGPSLYGLVGQKRQMTDGSVVVADREYIRESILEPYHKLTAGYPDKTMPEYKGQLSEEQILDLYAYIQSLGVVGTSSQSTNTATTDSRTTTNAKGDRP
ncbi:MAG: cytochrome c oxidase subunit II [Fimbriimonadaceae bacterium]|nr:cytochrome c oxidase subunit II [Fimbriimonadaceae bacterium]